MYVCMFLEGVRGGVYLGVDRSIDREHASARQAATLDSTRSPLPLAPAPGSLRLRSPVMADGGCCCLAVDGWMGVDGL